MKAYKITSESGGQPLIIHDFRVLPDLIGDTEYDEVGDKYQVEIIEISDEEFDGLPEWGGF